MRLYEKAAAVVGLGLLLTTNTQAAPELGSSADKATAGYYQLHWSGRGNNKATLNFVLEESPSASFANPTVLYRGPDTATLVSGRPDGTYYYRIRRTANPNDWSDTVGVTVRHHPLSRALLFFGLGALVFLATLTIVIRGNKTHPAEGE